jgi:hypothetical protein
MTTRPTSPPSADAGSSAEPADDEYRLAFIRPARAPSGNSGTDWLMYNIARGSDVITGYRRGDIASATLEVEKIVALLNERRLIKRR